MVALVTRSTTARVLRSAKAFLAELGAYGVTDRAAALTYYAVMSIAPALVIGVALTGLLGGAAGLVDQVTEFAPGPARSVLEGIIDDVRGSETSASVLLLAAGLATALWSASGYVGAFGRAANAIRSDSGAPTGWREILSRLAVTVLMFVLLFLITFMIVVSGPVAEQAATLVGLGDDVPRLWSLLKWPAILLAMVAVVGLLMSTTGGLVRARPKLVSVGSLTAVGLWLALSVAFTFYVSNFGSYSRVYGSLAGVVVFLIWLWLTNVALLVGVLVDERCRRRRATVVR